MTKPTALYCRVSSEKQKDNYSLETQEQGCLDYAQRLGIEPYRDEAYVDTVTATNFDRPSLDEVIELAKAGKIGSVIVYVQDRLSRGQPHDVWNMTLMLLEHGVVVHACDTGPLITSTDFMNAVPMLIKAEAARTESQRFRERSMRGKKAKAESGKVMVTFPKFGYDMNATNDNFVPNEFEAGIVRQVFSWYIDGDEKCQKMGLGRIANRLSEMRIPTKRDTMTGSVRRMKHRKEYGIWTTNTVYDIVKDEVYAGVWYFNRRYSNGKEKPREEWIAVDVPAIVSREVFEAARAQAALNRTYSQKNARGEFLMRGRLSCAKCGLSFQCVHNDHRGYERTYTYSCLGQRLKYSPDGKTRICHGSFDLRELDNAVWEAVKTMIKNPDTLLAGLRQRQADKEAQLQPDRDYLRRCKDRLEKLNSRLEIVRQRYLDFLEPDEKQWLDEQRQSINKQRNIEQATITDLEQRLADAQVDEIPPEKIIEFCVSIQKGIDHFTFERKRQVIELLDIKAIAHRGAPVKRQRKGNGTGTITISGYVPVPEIQMTGGKPSDGVVLQVP